MHAISLRLGALILACLPVLAQATEPDQFYAVTRVSGTDRLAMRTKPSDTTPILYWFAFNAVNITNLGVQSKGWCQVMNDKMRVGWSACKYLTPADNGNRYYSTQGYRDFLAIRKMPSSSAPMVGKIPPYETGLQGTGECNATWCPIDYQGKRGWVGRKYLASWSF
jgi:uncharacterized protein YgiM (DUF1202 family)